MKYCIVIGDGMADHPVPELGNRTPLEAAKIPVMDSLAAKGEAGCVRTVPEGVPAGSDTAILSICGYDPRTCYTGRAPLEAAGAGVTLQDGDTAYRCNMIALEDGAIAYERKKILSHSGGSVDGETARRLVEDLLMEPAFSQCAEENGLTLHASPSFRHIAVQKGAKADGLVTTPPHDHLGEPCGPLLPQGGTAEALRKLMRLAHMFLDIHPLNEHRRKEGKLPANGLWFWAQGTVTALPSLREAYGKTGFVVSAVPLVRGIGALAGLDSIDVPGATGELDTNYEGKVAAVLRGLADGWDFALLHVEAPDECTHMGDLKGKLEAIRRLDTRVLAPLKAGLDQSGEDYRLLVLSDHKTLTSTRGHNGEPVPFLLYDSRRDTRSGAAYNEASCQSTGLCIEQGHTLIARLFETA